MPSNQHYHIFPNFFSTAWVNIAFQPLKKKRIKRIIKKKFLLQNSHITDFQDVGRKNIPWKHKQNIYYHQRECTKSDFDRKLVKCDTIQTQTKVQTKSKDFRTQNKSNLKFWYQKYLGEFFTTNSVCNRILKINKS